LVLRAVTFIRRRSVIRKVPKIAAIAVGAVLVGGAAAAAVGAPDAADDDRTTASEQTGVEVPASPEAHPTKADHPGTDAQDEAEVEATKEVDDEGVDEEVDADEEEGTDDAVEDSGGPVDNHGAEVSAVAKDDSTTGREHGEAVSTVARDNHGAEASNGEHEDKSEEHGKP
jgi:hypothetical protein